MQFFVIYILQINNRYIYEHTHTYMSVCVGLYVCVCVEREPCLSFDSVLERMQQSGTISVCFAAGGKIIFFSYFKSGRCWVSLACVPCGAPVSVLASERVLSLFSEPQRRVFSRNPLSPPPATVNDMCSRLDIEFLIRHVEIK